MPAAPYVLPKEALGMLMTIIDAYAINTGTITEKWTILSIEADMSSFKALWPFSSCIFTGFWLFWLLKARMMPTQKITKTFLVSAKYYVLKHLKTTILDSNEPTPRRSMLSKKQMKLELTLLLYIPN